MHFLFLAAQFEFMTKVLTMIIYFILCTSCIAGPNIKWDVLHARICGEVATEAAWARRGCTGRNPCTEDRHSEGLMRSGPAMMRSRARPRALASCTRRCCCGTRRGSG